MISATAASCPAEIGSGPTLATMRLVESSGTNTEKYVAKPTATAAFEPV